LFRRLALAVMLGCCGPVLADPSPSGGDVLAGMEALAPARISAIGKDGTLTLEDGRQLRLAGIEFPHRPLNRHVKEVLAALMDGNPPILHSATDEPDRWGRWPVHVVSADGRWVQDALLRQGLARVATSPDDRLAAAEMLAAETEARDAKRGLWADPAFMVRRSDQALHWLDSVQVVEGLVTSADSVRGVVYLNLGDDWKHSLGIRIPHGLLRHFAYDPISLNGHHLRVRGWIGKGVGPLIEISHAEQLEVLDGPAPAPVAAPAKEGR